MSRDIPYRSPSDAFAAAAARRPDAPFLLAPASAGLPYAPEGFRIEYGAFKTEMDRLRAEYAAAGYGRGARVALLLGSDPGPQAHLKICPRSYWFKTPHQFA